MWRSPTDVPYTNPHVALEMPRFLRAVDGLSDVRRYIGLARSNLPLSNSLVFEFDFELSRRRKKTEGKYELLGEENCDRSGGMGCHQTSYNCMVLWKKAQLRLVLRDAPEPKRICFCAWKRKWEMVRLVKGDRVKTPPRL